LGQPALTARAFVPDPFGPPGGRLYGSGDRVRRRGDGVLEYLGRVDHQMKIRGYRIEPGEIESALRSVPGVADAVVIARADAAPGGGIVAYVVGRDGAPPASDTLRACLAGLPEYMVPAAFVPIEHV